MGLKLGKILKGVVKVADQAVLGGVLSNKGEDTSDAPRGVVDKVKLFGSALSSLAFLILLYLLLTGKIDFDQFKEAVDASKELQG